jgi:hypothetical protein
MFIPPFLSFNYFMYLTAQSVARHTLLNRRVINELDVMSWKECRRKRSWSGLGQDCCTGIYLDGLRKTRRTKVRIAGFRYEIRTQGFPNVNRDL